MGSGMLSLFTQIYVFTVNIHKSAYRIIFSGLLIPYRRIFA